MGIKTVLRYEVSCDHCDRVDEVTDISHLFDQNKFDSWVEFEDTTVLCHDCWDKAFWDAAFSNQVLPSHRVTGYNHQAIRRLTK